MRKILSIIYALVMIISSTYAAIQTGTCGTNLSWSINTRDSTMVIEGFGKMNSPSPFSFEQYKSYVKYLYLPEGMTSIGYEAFKNCTNLVRVNIPRSILQSGNGAFKSCEKLDSVLITDIASWCAIDFYWDKYYNGATSNPMTNAKHMYVNGELLTDLVIPDNVKVIGNYAFINCEDLKTLVIQEGDSIIGISAFSHCTSLTTVTIPSSVKEVWYGAFSGCAKITKVNIADIGAWSSISFSFYSYTSDSITNPLYYAKSLYLSGEKVTDLVIPEGVKYIGQYAFHNCKDLVSVTLPSTTISVGGNAFRYCSNISKLTVAATIPPENARYCGIRNSKCKLYVPEESIDTYANSVWWEDFLEIRAIGSQLRVCFVDWDGTILSCVDVDEGESATSPEVPIREGYTFIGWDKDFDNVSEDMTVIAQYRINRYEVRFVDWDAEVLKSDSVDWNTSATAPANPYRKGFTFKGWDKKFDHVKSDLTVNALYEIGEETNIVITFKNGNDGNTILSYPIILKIPEAPNIEGFTFQGWRPVAEYIDGAIEIEAIYTSETTAASEVYVNPSNPTQKLIRDGNVYILSGIQAFTISGQKVR